MSDRVRTIVIAVVAALAVAGPMLVVGLGADRGAASFGDTERVGRNRLASATVDVAAHPAVAAVRAENIAPGDVVTGVVELSNDGTIALHYSLGVEGSAAPALDPWLTWWFAVHPVSDGCPLTPRTLAALATFGSAAEAVATDWIEVTAADLGRAGTVALVGEGAERLEARTLDVGETELLCVVVTLPLGVPNTAQDASAMLTVRVDAQQAVDGAST